MPLASPEITVRPAVLADAPAMNSICVSMRQDAVPSHHPITGQPYEGYESLQRDWLKQNEATGMQKLQTYIAGKEPDSLLNGNEYFAAVAEVNRQVAGYVLAVFIINYAIRYRGTMVLREYAGMGIGDTLEEARYAWASHIGETIFVQTASVHGHNFFARRGFRPICGFTRSSSNLSSPICYMPFFKNPENTRRPLHFNMIPLPDIPAPIRTDTPPSSISYTTQ
jgi:GNAT superfamily N-acetyltransferase